MKIDLEKLKELSNLVKEDCSTDLNEYIFLCKVNVVKDKPPVEVDRSWARFIKAANPQTILKLIELIEAYENALKFYENVSRLMMQVRNIQVSSQIIEQHYADNGDRARRALSERKRILGE